MVVGSSLGPMICLATDSWSVMVPRAVSLWNLLCRYDSLKFKRPAFFYSLSAGIKVYIITQGLRKGYLVEDPGPTAGS